MELQSIEYKFKRDTSRSIIEIEIKPRPFEMTLNWNQSNGAELKRNSIRCQPPAAAPFLWATTFGLLIPAHCVANSVDFLRIYWWIYEKIASCCCHCCCGNKTFNPPLITRSPPPLHSTGLGHFQRSNPSQYLCHFPDINLKSSTYKCLQQSSCIVLSELLIFFPEFADAFRWFGLPTISEWIKNVWFNNLNNLSTDSDRICFEL